MGQVVKATPHRFIDLTSPADAVKQFMRNGKRREDTRVIWVELAATVG